MFMMCSPLGCLVGFVGGGVVLLVPALRCATSHLMLPC